MYRAHPLLELNDRILELEEQVGKRRRLEQRIGHIESEKLETAARIAEFKKDPAAGGRADYRASEEIASPFSPRASRQLRYHARQEATELSEAIEAARADVAADLSGTSQESAAMQCVRDAEAEIARYLQGFRRRLQALAGK